MTLLRCALVAVGIAGVLPAQWYRASGYRDLELARDRPQPASSFLRLRGAATYTLPQDADESVGRTDEFSGYGSVLYHDDAVGDRKSTIDAYAGTDGALLGVREHFDPGSSAILEVSARYFPYYREGFYDGDDFVATGRYEGFDWGAYLGLATQSEGYTFELGPFYRHYSFSRGDDTAPQYVIPDDYDAFGGRLHLEQSTLQLDRTYRRPVDGFLTAVRVEFEWNTSQGRFGTDIWKSELPDAFWRGFGHLEWYFPTGDGAVEFQLDGGVAAAEDRIWAFDAQKPTGHWFGDARLGYRFDLGGFSFAPYGNLLFTHTIDEVGSDSTDDFWFGGGVKMDWMLDESLSLWGEYSYLNNANRPSISFQNDVWGEHQFFLGLELTFGGS
ncbi:MAG: hypothetical protein IPM29_26175 [Planctomycetes bacterium]|nr:hypothetical protein [Planctomycetota bacterium]